MRAYNLFNLVNYWNENKDNIIYKVNGVLLVVLIATLISILSIRDNSFTFSYVDALESKGSDIKLEQAEKEVEEASSFNIVTESFNTLHLSGFSCNRIIDEDYIKIYPYYVNSGWKNQNSDEAIKNSITVRSSEELSSFVSLDTHSNSYTCILNRIYSRLTFNWNKYKLLKKHREKNLEVKNLYSFLFTPFIWVKAREPGHLNMFTYF